MKKGLILRMLCLLLALTMLTAVVSCGGGGDGTLTDSESGEEVTTAPQETGPETDANGYLLDSVPDGLDYENQDVTVMGWSEAKNDFVGSEESRDALEYATFVRNATVEKRLNINLVFDTSVTGGDGAQDEYISKVEMNMRVGSPYDLIAPYSRIISNFAMDGYLEDLSKYSVINAEAPWWYADFDQNARINGKLYFISGSISAQTVLQTMVMLVNLDMANAQDLEDPRKLADDGNWTLAAFYEMIKDIGQDTGSDENVKDSMDTFGFVAQHSTVLDGFYSGAGLRFLEFDKDSGRLTLSSDFSGTKASDLLDALLVRFRGEDAWTANNGLPTFTGQRALLLASTFGSLKSSKDNISFRYGYLPYPKMDTDQDDYYSVCGFPCSIYAIPASASNKELSAYVLECLASAAYRTVRPELYQTVKYQYGNDVLDAKMFDLIVDGLTFDSGRLFMHFFDWKNSPVAIFRELAFDYHGGSDPRAESLYTELEKRLSGLQGTLDTINYQFFGSN